MAKALSPAAAAREAAGFTVERAARRLNLAPATLQRYERESMPDKIIDRAAYLYKCDGAQLFFSAGYLAQLAALKGQRGTPESNSLATTATGADTLTRAGRRPKTTRPRRDPMFRLLPGGQHSEVK